MSNKSEKSPFLTFDVKADIVFLEMDDPRFIYNVFSLISIYNYIEIIVINPD